MKITVRKARVGDETRMAEIQVAAWQRAYAGIMSLSLLDSLDIAQKTNMWRNALEHVGKGSYTVSEIDGHVEGFAVFGPARDQDLNETDSAEIVSINVNPDRWGVGLGRSLVEFMISRLSADGFGSIHLWVATPNETAIRFYEQHDFTREGKVKADPKHSGIQEVRLVRTIG